jgi:hypothetical protein
MAWLDIDRLSQRVTESISGLALASVKLVMVGY